MPSAKPSLRDRFNLSQIAINHAGLTLFFWLAISIAGVFAFGSLKYALFPDITFPVVVVNASAPFETALATETDLTNPIEAELEPLDQLNRIFSTTYAGQSVMNLRFKVGTDLEASTQAVEDKLDAMALPEAASYQVIPLNLNEEAAVSYAISGDDTALETLAETAETDIIPEIEEIPGVLRVDLLGTAEQTLADAAASLAAGNETDLQGNTLEATNPDILNPPTLIRFNGEDALAFQVIKRGDANTLEVVSAVESAVEKLQTALPAINFTLAATQANYIKAATQATIDSLLLAIAIAILVIFVFLKNWRATLITALAIPISLLGTAIVMAIYGFNLETITLLALALVIGIIVDDAIVEVENIIRHMEAGASPKQAAIAATREIGLTVSASTLTIVAVFLPVAFMGGTVGQFFKPFGLTVSAAVLTSLLVARTLSPVLAVYWLRLKRGGVGGVGGAEGAGGVGETPIALGDNAPTSSQGAKMFGLPSSSNGSAVNGASQNGGGNGRYTGQNAPKVPTELITEAPQDSWLSKGYGKLLSWSLNHRLAVIGIAIASLIAGIALIPLVPQGFIPKLDRGEFNITYQAPLPQIADIAGLDPSQIDPSQIDPSQVDALDPAQLNTAQLNTAQLAQGQLDPSQLNLNPAEGQPGSQALPNPLQIIFDQSRQVAESLEATTLDTDAVESVFTTVGVRGKPNEGKLYIKLKTDRTVSTAEVQDQLRADLPELEDVSTSVEDLQFVDTGGEKPLQVVLLGDDLDQLNTAVLAIQERVKDLPGFVDVSVTGGEATEGGISEINHRKGQRVAYVTANLSDGQALGDATDQVVAIANEVIPPGITLDLGGDSARLGEVLGSFGTTLGLAVICMLVVLLIPFGRLLEPAVVGLSLPFAIVGAMLALLITQSDFGMISVIGLLFLLGLLDKNALLLMDYINQLRRSGLNRDRAIMVTGLVRLRPILMTTASTILGMLPIALGIGAGSELRQPMAVAIIGGLITSTLLSLIVVPVLYTLLEDGWQQLRGQKP